MKTCPACKSIYTDDSLSFCLTDGTPLGISDASERFGDSEPTVKFPDAVKTAASSAPAAATIETRRQKRSVSPVWVAMTFLLFGLLIVGGALAVWLFYFSNGGNIAGTENTIADRRGGLAPNKNTKNVLPEPTRTATPNNQSPPLPTPAATSPSATYRVVGIRSDDVLYIRPAPNDLKTYLGKIPPDGTGIIITGPGEKAGNGIWYPINYKGTGGWVFGRYLAKEAGFVEKN